MFGIFKGKNAKDWKTTTMGVIGGVLTILGLLYPEKVDAETQEVIKTATNEIIVGVGMLIQLIVPIFGSKDGDKD